MVVHDLQANAASGMAVQAQVFRTRLKGLHRYIVYKTEEKEKLGEPTDSYEAFTVSRLAFQFYVKHIINFQMEVKL